MRELQSVDPDVKRVAYRTWRAQFKQIALVNAWRFWAVRAGYRLGVAGWFGSLVVAPIVVALALPIHMPLWHWLWTLLLYGVGVVAVATPITALIPTGASYRRWLGKSVVIALACLAVMALIVMYGDLPDGIEVAVAATFVLPTIVIAYSIVLSFVSGALAYSGQRVLRRRHPEAVVVDALAGVLLLLELNPGRWRELALKRQLMAFIEVAAIALQFDLPRHLKSGDATTDAWIREEAREWAHALRELKKSVFGVGDDVRTDLTKAVAAALGSVSLGDWESLERLEPPAAKDQPRETKVRDALATALRAALPGVVLIVLQQTSFALSDSAADYATIAVLAWAAVTLLARFDPLFSEKIAALSDAKEFFQPKASGPK